MGCKYIIPQVSASEIVRLRPGTRQKKEVLLPCTVGIPENSRTDHRYLAYLVRL